MKILFLHLSDAHFKDKTFCSDKIINAQLQALNTVGRFDYCFIMFSGDLALSGQINEYKVASSYLGKIWNKIIKKFELKNKVYTCIVPGNHDINFNGVNRDRKQIKEMLNAGDIEKNIDSELKNFDNFYNSVKKYNLFKNNKLYDCRIYDVDEQKIQINLINSELFSSCNDSLKDDDKGLHFLPNSIWDSIERRKDADFVVTMSHRGPEWFLWEPGNVFKKYLFNNTDLFLYGHEHFDDIQNICQKDNTLLKSIAQGIDFDKKNISFTTLLVDLTSKKISTTMFSWNNEEDMFIGRNAKIFEISNNYNNKYNLVPNENYKKEVSLDEDKRLISSYYVFPGIEIEGKEQYEEIKEFSEFLNLLTSKKHVIIEGNDSSGKTSLLKQVYLNLLDKYVPIYLNVDNIVNKNPEMVLKNAFEMQYGKSAIDYEKYLQIDKERKIILIDDLSKIKSKYITPLQEYLFEKVGHVVCIVEPKQNIDFLDAVKEMYQPEDIIKLNILPFYFSKRLELIKKNLICINQGEYNDLNTQAEAINKFINENIKLFSLSPRFIKMYVEYCINDTELTNANKNVFGRVFETNLVNRIRKFACDSDIDEYSVLLEEIAYQIHFNEKYPLPIENMVQIINNYNQEYRMKVNVQKFCKVMVDAKVLVEEDNNYYFYNDCYLAYFVAKSLNTKYNNGEGENELSLLIKNICFNINGDILLFLSYITSNLGILKVIRKSAEEHMKDWEEFDIDKRNIGFVLNAKSPDIDSLPTAKDREQKEKNDEKYEKEASRHDLIEREKFYDYNKDDVNKEGYKIAQALKFMDLICKILPGFNHRLRMLEKEKIVKDVYSFPNKIIYRILSPVDQEFEGLVRDFYGSISLYKEDITEDKVRQAFINAAEFLVLKIYDRAARQSVTEKTIDIIEEQEKENTNYKIQQIMFYENLGKFGKFADASDDLYDKSKIPFVKSVLKNVMYKHFLCNKDLKIVGKVESVARKYFGKSFNKTALLK